MTTPNPSASSAATGDRDRADSSSSLLETQPDATPTPTPTKSPKSYNKQPHHQYQQHSLLFTAEDWYDAGERVLYDPLQKAIVNEETDYTKRVFRRVILPEDASEEEGDEGETEECDQRSSSSLRSPSPRWMTFLPGNPEGSFGFSQLEEALSCSGKDGYDLRLRCDTDETQMSAETSFAGGEDEDEQEGDGRVENGDNNECGGQNHQQQQQQHRIARLYLDYLGQGNSDASSSNITCPSSTSALQTHEGELSNASPVTTPSPSSPTKQRADLVEAHWHALNVERTTIVSVEDSSLVVQELLQRQRARLATGIPFPKILHVLSLNGRYVAKSRHINQLATVTQLLRSERMGHTLSSKAQHSDLILYQCLQPSLRGVHNKHMRRQVAAAVRRHDGALSLHSMAQTVDDHLDHKYRWHLPLLVRHFTRNQGITFHLMTTNRTAKGHTSLVQQHLQNDLEDGDLDAHAVATVRYHHIKASNATSTGYLLGSLSQLQPLVGAIHQLSKEQIPLSADNDLTSSTTNRGIATPSQTAAPTSVPTSVASSFPHPYDEEDEEDKNNNKNYYNGSEGVGTDGTLDTRLDTEIVFDSALDSMEEYDRRYGDGVCTLEKGVL